MHISVRAAMPADLQALQSFQQGIIAAERPFDPTLRAGIIHYYDLARLLADEGVKLVIAESGSEPVGCGFARIEAAKDYLTHREHAYLGLMYVDPRFRGQGINQRILEHLQRWCRFKGVTELRLDVYAGNSSAIRAYEKAGFSSHLLKMRMALPDEAESAIAGTARV